MPRPTYSIEYHKHAQVEENLVQIYVGTGRENHSFMLKGVSSSQRNLKVVA